MSKEVFEIKTELGSPRFPEESGVMQYRTGIIKDAQASHTIDLSDITWDTPILLRVPILPGFPGIMEYKVYISDLEFNSGTKQFSLAFDISGFEKKRHE